MLDVLLKNPEFRKLWWAQVVSQAGDWFNRIAVLALIAGLSGPRAAAGVGALYAVELAVRLLPAALLGPIAGPVADRISRRGLMIATDLARALVVLGMAFVREPAHLPWLYVLLVAQMGLAVFFESARSAALPNTVDRDGLHAAYALSAATWSTTLTVGTLLSAALIRVLGVRGMFVADAATYVVSALFLVRLRLPPMPDHPEAFSWRDVLLLVDLRRGLTHVRERGVAAGLWAKAFWGPAGGFLVMLSVAGRERFAVTSGAAADLGGIGDTSLATAAGSATAILLAGRGLGTGFGPVLARRWFGSGDRALLAVTFGGFLVAVVGYSIFGLTTNLWLAALCVLAAHLGGGSLWVSSTTFWQKHIDDAFRGRVRALEMLSFTIGFSVGGSFAGLVYDRTQSVGTTTFAICGAVLVAGLAWGALFLRRPVPDTPPAAPVPLGCAARPTPP